MPRALGLAASAETLFAHREKDATTAFINACVFNSSAFSRQPPRCRRHGVICTVVTYDTHKASATPLLSDRPFSLMETATRPRVSPGTDSAAAGALAAGQTQPGSRKANCLLRQQRRASAPVGPPPAASAPAAGARMAVPARAGLHRDPRAPSTRRARVALCSGARTPSREGRCDGAA